ncbi:MAG: hypothetical protein ACR2JB_06785 [Bryobacteraceae bacterium]
MEDIIEFASDALGNNPFNKDDPRQDQWVSASRFATEEIERFKSEILQRNTTEPNELRSWTLDYLTGRFNIQAKWLSAFVGGYNSAEWYEQELERLADGTISLAREKCPKSIPKGLLVAELQLRLAQVSAHWIAEALKLARESPAKDATDPQRCPATWENVEIRFLSDHKVQVTIEDRTYPQNYAEMGFEDRRSKTPRQAWLLLRGLAETNGTIQAAANGRDWAKVEKRIQELRKIFRGHFSIKDDPLPFVQGGVGYRARFKISRSPSYHR